MVFNAIQTVLMVFIILAIGYLLCVKKIIVPEQHSQLISKLITYLAAPCILFYYMVVNFTFDMLTHSFWYFGVVFAVLLIANVLGYGFAYLLKVPKNRRGLFAVMCSQSNTIFVGMPVCLGIFGPDSIPYVLYYYAMNTLVFWTFNSTSMQRDAGITERFSLKSLLRFFPAPLAAFFLSILVIALKIPMPDLLLKTTETIGNMTTPLSVLYVGVILYQAGWRSIVPDLSLSVMSVCRIILAPAAAFLLTRLTGLPTLPSQVFTVQAAMPALTFSVVYAGMVGADTKYAMRGVVLTTFLSLLTIPVYMAVMPLL